MEKLLELIIKSIVQKPKKVKIKKAVPTGRQEKTEGFVNFSLKVDPEDLKIVIGKRGRTIRAIRNLIRLKAIKEGARVNLELEED
jgi:predicted RNA-binding protein YlqC (UPF0109 family)